MKFSKLDAPTLKELFIQEMEQMILSGELKNGERLPSERELAESMQVSRSVVNAGLSELARKGFLEIKPRVGTFVADYRRDGTVETLLSIMKYNGGQLKPEETRSMLELKLVLDILALELVIPKLTSQNIQQLEEALYILETTPSDEEAGKASHNFYHELAFMSGNTLLPLIYNSFKAPVVSLWARYARKNGKELMYNSSLRLLAAIKEQDFPKAKSIIETTVGNTIDGPTEIYHD